MFNLGIKTKTEEVIDTDAIRWSNQKTNVCGEEYSSFVERMKKEALEKAANEKSKSLDIYNHAKALERLALASMIDALMKDKK